MDQSDLATSLRAADASGSRYQPCQPQCGWYRSTQTKAPRYTCSFPLLSDGYPHQSTALHLLISFQDPPPNRQRHRRLSCTWLAMSTLGRRKSNTSGFSMSKTPPLCTSAPASVHGGVSRQGPQFLMPQIVANEREDMTGGGDPTGVAAVLPHTDPGT
jgi:hypothetical protein